MVEPGQLVGKVHGNLEALELRPEGGAAEVGRVALDRPGRRRLPPVDLARHPRDESLEDRDRLLDEALLFAGVLGLGEGAPVGVQPVDRGDDGVAVGARVSAVVAMRVEDYYQNGKRWWFRLHEKGGKRHEVPAHHNAETYIDAYITAAGITGQPKGPLFRSVDKHRQLKTNSITRTDRSEEH